MEFEFLRNLPALEELDLVDVKHNGICVEVAQNIAAERLDDDNRQIVQMMYRGEPISHWYFRSKTFIYQPNDFGHLAIPHYIGPTDQAPPQYYSPGTYIVDEELTTEISVKPASY